MVSTCAVYVLFLGMFCKEFTSRCAHAHMPELFWEMLCLFFEFNLYGIKYYIWLMRGEMLIIVKYCPQNNAETHTPFHITHHSIGKTERIKCKQHNVKFRGRVDPRERTNERAKSEGRWVSWMYENISEKCVRALDLRGNIEPRCCCCSYCYSWWISHWLNALLLPLMSPLFLFELYQNHSLWGWIEMPEPITHTHTHTKTEIFPQNRVRMARTS